MSFRGMICYLLSLVLWTTCHAISTLDEAIALAIETNTAIKLAEQGVAMAALSKSEARSGFFPTVTATIVDGERRTQIADLEDTLDENTKKLTVNQMLFRGFSSVADVAAARHAYDASVARLNQAKQDMALAVANYYITLFYLNKLLIVETEKSTLMKEAVVLAQQQFALQDKDYMSLSDIILEYNQSQLSLSRLKASIRANQVQLAQAINRPIDDDIVFTQPAIVPLDTQDTLISHIKDNPAVQALALDAQSLAAKVKSSQGQFLPQVSLYYQHEEEESSVYFNGEGITNNLTYINVEVPLFQGGREYVALNRAKAAKDMTDLESQQLNIRLFETVSQDYSEFQAISDQLGILESMLAITEQSRKNIQQQMDEQVISKLDGGLQQASLLDLSIEKLNLERDRYLAYFRLLHATGALPVSNAPIASL